MEQAKILATGVYLYGVLYVLIIAAAAISWHSPLALYAAAATAAITYLCFFVQVYGLFNLARVLVLASIAVGAASGFLLVRGI